MKAESDPKGIRTVFIELPDPDLDLYSEYVNMDMYPGIKIALIFCKKVRENIRICTCIDPHPGGRGATS
jgi:hypothetical protein